MLFKNKWKKWTENRCFMQAFYFLCSISRHKTGVFFHIFIQFKWTYSRISELSSVTAKPTECARFFNHVFYNLFQKSLSLPLNLIKPTSFTPFWVSSHYRQRGHKTLTLSLLQGNCEQDVRSIFSSLCCRGSLDSPCVPVPPLSLSPLWCCSKKKRKKEKKIISFQFSWRCEKCKC